MDFITGLPNTNNLDAVLVVVDRFTKYSLFVPCSKTCDARELAQIFLKHVFMFFGTPDEIISDRGVVFTSNFWKELTSALAINLKFSSAYHPQTDGQTERTNQTLEQYLRCFVDFTQDNWVNLLPMAQFNYNITYQVSIKMTTSEALMGINPTFIPGRSLSAYSPGIVDRLVELNSTRVKLRESLSKAIKAYTTQANKHRRKVEFNVGDWVYLSTSNLPLTFRTKKLSPRRVGPYEITSKNSSVSYKLAIPSTWNIHNVFHVSLLTKGSKPNSTEQLPLIVDPLPSTPLVEHILDHKLRYNKLYFLVKWSGLSCEESTWEPLTSLTKDLPLVRSYLCTRGCVLEGDSVRIL